MTSADLSIALGSASFVASAWKYLHDQKAHQAERAEQTRQLQEQTELLRQVRDHFIPQGPIR